MEEQKHGPLPANDMQKYQNQVARLNRAPRYEKPKWFDRELAEFRGYDSLTGQPRYRCVFGQDPEAMVFRCGKWCFKYVLGVAHQDIRFSLRGQPIRLDGQIVGYYETDLLDVRHFAEPVGMPFYFIEKLTFPRCNEEEWEKNHRWYNEGFRHDDIMGPYPRQGYYDKFLQLVHPDFTPAPPSRKAMERIKQEIIKREQEEERNKGLSIEQQIQNEIDEDEAYQQRLDEQCRQDLMAAFMDIKLQVLGSATSFPGARVGAGMNAT